MLTSANAVRLAGPALATLLALPLYAVGEATAAVASAAGFARIHAGSADAAALVTQMVATGVKRPLHLAGRDHRAPDDAPIPIVRRIVYAADPVAVLPQTAETALRNGAVALLHSPRAGTLLAELAAKAGLDPTALRVAAISAAAARDWPGAVVADRPTDDALLAAAATLCDKG